MLLTQALVYVDAVHDELVRIADAAWEVFRTAEQQSTAGLAFEGRKVGGSPLQAWIALSGRPGARALEKQFVFPNAE